MIAWIIAINPTTKNVGRRHWHVEGLITTPNFDTINWHLWL